ncbi:hypothetical protein J6590_016331 [Homalodisca vitripennis]|nr:hypothetical protein J6590_016331 [Homalodisca vitripennis]
MTLKNLLSGKVTVRKAGSDNVAEGGTPEKEGPHVSCVKAQPSVLMPVIGTKLTYLLCVVDGGFNHVSHRNNRGTRVFPHLPVICDNTAGQVSLYQLVKAQPSVLMPVIGTKLTYLLCVVDGGFNHVSHRNNRGTRVFPHLPVICDNTAGQVSLYQLVKAQPSVLMPVIGTKLTYLLCVVDGGFNHVSHRNLVRLSSLHQK